MGALVPNSTTLSPTQALVNLTIPLVDKDLITHRMWLQRLVYPMHNLMPKDSNQL